MGDISVDWCVFDMRADRCFNGLRAKSAAWCLSGTNPVATCPLIWFTSNPNARLIFTPEAKTHNPWLGCWKDSFTHCKACMHIKVLSDHVSTQCEILHLTQCDNMLELLGNLCRRKQTVHNAINPNKTCCWNIGPFYNLHALLLFGQWAALN